MASRKRYFEFNRYPKYKQMYIRAFQRMIDQYTLKSDWKTGEEVFAWWMGEIKPTYKQQITIAEIIDDLRYEYDL